MATDASFGLRPIKTSGAKSNKIVISEYYVPSSYGTALFVGDPVLKTGTTNTAAVNGRAAGRLPEINRAADTGAITGVIVGFALDKDVADTVLHNPASTERIVYVCDDPDQEYEVQCDDTFAVTDVGLNTNVIFTNAGSTATGISGCELDISDKGTTATLQCKILRIAEEDTPDGDNSVGANTNVVVRINNHTEADNIAGV